VSIYVCDGQMGELRKIPELNCESMEAHIRWGLRSPTFEGDMCWPTVMYLRMRLSAISGECAGPAHVADECIRCCEGRQDGNAAF